MNFIWVCTPLQADSKGSIINLKESEGKLQKREQVEHGSFPSFKYWYVVEQKDALFEIPQIKTRVV